MKLVVKTMPTNGEIVAKRLSPKLPDSSLEKKMDGKFLVLTWTSRYQAITVEAKQTLWKLENQEKAIKVLEMPEVK